MSLSHMHCNVEMRITFACLDFSEVSLKRMLADVLGGTFRFCYLWTILVVCLSLYSDNSRRCIMYSPNDDVVPA
jgi:hypothetical protein